jgi:hypothetical protein
MVNTGTNSQGLLCPGGAGSCGVVVLVIGVEMLCESEGSAANWKYSFPGLL